MISELFLRSNVKVKQLIVLTMMLLGVPAEVWAWKMEAGRINLSSTSGRSALESHTFQQVYDTPPIVVALPTTAGPNASALRIRNVTTTGFQMSPVEPNSEDGPHTNMAVAYIAIEPGTHTLPNGEVIEAGLLSTAELQYNGVPSGRKGWERLNFSQSFSNPILIADIQSTNNETNAIPRAPSQPWLTVAVNDLRNSRVDLALERSEEYDRRSGSNYRFDALGNPEDIGYIVMNGAITGNFRANGNQLINFETIFRSSLVDGWSQSCDSINFSGSYSSTPIAVATKSSHNEVDGGWLRECSVNNSRIQLTIDEDTAQDRERSTVNREDVSLLVFSNSFFYDSNASVTLTSNHLMLEADRVTLAPDRFTAVSFKQIYDTPPAVFLLENDNNPEPSSVRIRNVTQRGFEVVPVEPDSRVANATDQSTTIHYLAVTQGEFSFPDGKRIEIGPLFPPEEIANYQSKRLSGDSWFTFNFANSFNTTPAVISHLQSMNNETGHVPGSVSSPWLTMAIRNIDTNGGQLALDRAETNTGSITSAERFAYLAIEPGTIGTFKDIDGTNVDAEAQRTADSIRGTTSCYDYNFLQSYTGNPLVIGSQMSWDGGDGGWLRRCSVSSSRVSLKIEEDWALDTDRSHTTERAGFMAFNDAFRADFSLVGNYQLEGPVWSGAAGEVTDSSDTGANGRRYGNANPQPGQVCYGAQFDGNGDYIEIPDNSAHDIDEELTVMAWVNIDTIPGSGLKTIVSKNENFEFHVDDQGRIFWWWNNSMGASRSFASTTSITAGNWHHVAIVYSRKNASQQIFIDGIERGTQSYANESLRTNTLPVYIGTDYNYRSRDFAGSIDEVKIFERALPAAAIQLYASDSRTCASCVLDSFEITQDTYALACPDTPAQVNISAKCTDGSTKTDYVGTVDLSSLSGSSFFADASGTTPITSLSYQTSDLGEQSAYLYFNDENPNVQVTANDTSAGVTATAVTGTDFRTFGFRTTQQPDHFACGDSTTMTLQAYGQNDDAAGGACEVIEGFSGNKNLDVWFLATTNNDNIAETVSTPLSIAGAPINEQSVGADNNLVLNFVAGEASFPIAYQNTARIIEINFRHDNPPYDDTEFPPLTASTSDFVVKPDRFTVSAQNGGITLNGSNANATTTHPAGAPFDLTINAICEDGGTGSLASDYMPNSNSNTLVAFLERMSPTGTDTVNGDMSISSTQTLTSSTSATPVWTSTNIAPSAFTGGTYSFNNAQYSEVGVTRLYVRDQNYFGQETNVSAQTIGRFVPDYFEVSTTDGTLAPYCIPGSAPSFAYTGQTIGYNSVPTISLTATNRAGATTRNYTSGNYLKISPSDIASALNFPTTDRLQTGASGILTNLTYNTLPPATFASASNGIITYHFDGSDDFTYSKDANALLAPYTSNLRIQLSAFNDSDGVSASAPPYDIDPSGVEIRYGRMNMRNAFGPETSPLEIPLIAEYFNGSSFETNQSDSCTNYNASNAVITSSLSGGSTTASGAGTLNNGTSPLGSSISLSAPGPGNVGTVSIEYTADSWLRFDWDNDGTTADTAPRATATFGQYRGNDRIIFWREVED